MQNGNDRPPYIRFERRAVEDRTKDKTNGVFQMKDVDFVIIQRPGSRDTVERVADDFLADWETKARKGELPLSWAQDARKGYEFWKSGEEMPVNGTAIKGWCVLTPAQQANILQAGIRTVEDLAAVPDGSIGILGIGGVDLKRKASAWLSEAQLKGVVAQENANLKAQLDDQAKLLAQLSKELQELKGKK